MKLLVVDDSNMVRSRIARIVQGGALGDVTIVGMARDGVEALRAASQASPDIVTMDLTMPEMDGLACIPALLAAHPRARILVISALDDKSTAIRALRLGAHGFLPKPFTDGDLQLALLGLIQHKG
ncbi:response regulator transcription factor [Piscinibacter gummiphilus]|jgi:two-component system, chemotaxis family, chemotaxis protein CheY|uniref:Response regulator receiver protein n=1 Tax=Piscinibacter gummiphilus TaxID=946333 RepID=A0A1W6L789_9BURK|nr:response regulator [Piscinibacter gummiphilus]ARN20103.1 response regulator receiver protein [Piscinibacter gummiphilus]ATU64775.1 DNA-binding response regulator [Piscinibacter gummiphilus]GLS96992.1 chemotaxis protein CheY [Piscinibacter gummiphilus]